MTHQVFGSVKLSGENKAPNPTEKPGEMMNVHTRKLAEERNAFLTARAVIDKTLHSLPAQHSQDVCGCGPPHNSCKLNGGSDMYLHTLWPNHKSMNKESERRKTYIGWPVTFIHPDEMARAGFVYLKLKDMVQCVFCNIVVVKWEFGDNPFQDHKKHSPRCPLVCGNYCNNISIEEELWLKIT